MLCNISHPQEALSVEDQLLAGQQAWEGGEGRGPKVHRFVKVLFGGGRRGGPEVHRFEQIHSVGEGKEAGVRLSPCGEAGGTGRAETRARVIP